MDGADVYVSTRLVELKAELAVGRDGFGVDRLVRGLDVMRDDVLIHTVTTDYPPSPAV